MKALLQDLLRAMKIARGTDKAFKDKHSIYLAALDRYDHTIIQRAVDTLCNREGGDGIAHIRAVFEGARFAPGSTIARMLHVQCGGRSGAGQLQIQTKVMAMMQRLEQAFTKALKESKQTAGWPAKRRTETARALLRNNMGLLVLTKSGYSEAELADTIAACLRNSGLRP